MVQDREVAVNALASYIVNSGVKTPVSLELGLVKLSNQNTTRYFRAKINGNDVSIMVANVLGEKVSQARDSRNAFIVHGCGMDMGFYVQDRVYHMFERFGKGNLIHPSNYIYLGRIS